MNRLGEYQENGLVDKELYYYHGKITVCLLVKDGTVVARGVSICSPKDQFVKRIGRAKALGRALRAVTRREDNDLIIPYRNQIINNYEHNGIAHFIFPAYELFSSKSSYMPMLNQFEQKLVTIACREKEVVDA